MMMLFYQYDPYFTSEPDDPALRQEIPCFRVYLEDAHEPIAETNECLPSDVQERYAMLFTASPSMLVTLTAIAADADACTCHARSWYGKGHDTQCPIRLANDAIAEATGGNP